ncbi:hypothetical protein B566_EDAN009808, partial [Ephemera danica]
MRCKYIMKDFLLCVLLICTAMHVNCATDKNSEVYKSFLKLRTVLQHTVNFSKALRTLKSLLEKSNTKSKVNPPRNISSEQAYNAEFQRSYAAFKKFTCKDYAACTLKSVIKYNTDGTIKVPSYAGMLASGIKIWQKCCEIGAVPAVIETAAEMECLRNQYDAMPAGEPNNRQGMEPCVMIEFVGKFGLVDMACMFEGRYLCQ